MEDELMAVEVLSLGRSDIECSKARWAEVFSAYSPQARRHAAVLAAHNWDVLLIGDRVFLSSFYGSAGRWLPPTFGVDNQHLPEASAEEFAALYDGSKHPKTRLFAILARSDEGAGE